MSQGNTDEHVILLCPSCLAPIGELAHFCETCLAPLTSHAATDPIGQVWAQGYVYRRGVREPRSRLILSGVWLIFGPAFVHNLQALWFVLLGIIAPGRSIGDGVSGQGIVPLLIAFVFSLAIELLLLAILFTATRNYFLQRN